MGPEEIIKHGVAWGKTDAEIWQNPLFRALTLAERQACEALLAELRQQERAAEAAEHAGERSRNMPNFPARYREAVTNVVRDGFRPTWKSVATRLERSESQVRVWAKEDGLGSPATITRELRAGR
jgi:hypothetical protein